MKTSPTSEKKWKTPKKLAFTNKGSLRGNTELLEHLQNTRVVQHDLVYIIGLSPRIANKAVFFGRNKVKL